MKTQFDVQDLRGRRQQQQVTISSNLEIFTEVRLTKAQSDFALHYKRVPFDKRVSDN